MPTYEEVFNLAKSLPLVDQARLMKALSAQFSEFVEVDETEELVSAAELAESEAALQDYWAGRDPGITAVDLKRKLFGGNCGW